MQFSKGAVAFFYSLIPIDEYEHVECAFKNQYILVMGKVFEKHRKM